MIKNVAGSAAAEMALVLPFVLVLMFGSFEAGHFFWTQHKIVKSVRDGARFASRLDIDRLCPAGGGAPDAALITDIRNVTATGQLAGGGVAKVPGWAPGNVVVTPDCGRFVNTGIYSDLGENGPLITVDSGAVVYPSLFDALGFATSDLRLSARSSAAVMGI